MRSRGIAALNAKAQVEIFKEIARERDEQDEQWGGAEHDDEHDADEWESMIMKHANRLTGMDVCARAASPDYRARLIKIAAIAIAAIESFDRRNE